MPAAADTDMDMDMDTDRRTGPSFSATGKTFYDTCESGSVPY